MLLRFRTGILKRYNRLINTTKPRLRANLICMRADDSDDQEKHQWATPASAIRKFFPQHFDRAYKRPAARPYQLSWFSWAFQTNDFSKGHRRHKFARSRARQPLTQRRSRLTSLSIGGSPRDVAPDILRCGKISFSLIKAAISAIRRGYSTKLSSASRIVGCSRAWLGNPDSEMQQRDDELKALTDEKEVAQTTLIVIYARNRASAST